MDKSRRIVSKEDVLFAHKDGKIEPIEIETILPVGLDSDDEPIYMNLKVIPFTRKELQVFNEVPLNLNRLYTAKKEKEADTEAKVKLEIEFDKEFQKIREEQEGHIILERITFPKFTEEELKLLPQKTVDAFFFTLMHASKIPRSTILKTVETVKQEIEAEQDEVKG